MHDYIVDQALASDVGKSLGEMWMRRNLLALVAPADDPGAVTEALLAPDGGRPAADAEFRHCLTETEQARVRRARRSPAPRPRRAHRREARPDRPAPRRRRRPRAARRRARRIRRAALAAPAARRRPGGRTAVTVQLHNFPRESGLDLPRAARACHHMRADGGSAAASPWLGPAAADLHPGGGVLAQTIGVAAHLGRSPRKKIRPANGPRL